MPLRFIVPANDADRTRLVADYFTTSRLNIADQVRNDRALAFTIEPVTVNPLGADTLYSPDHEATDAYQFAIGLPDEAPESGTFTMTANALSTTSALAYNVSAATLQTALGTIFVAQSEAAPTVTELATGLFSLVGSSNGAIATGFLTGNAANLFPESDIFVIEEDLGGASTPYRLLVAIRQSPMCLAEPTTQLSATGVAVTDVQAQSATANRIQRIAFTQPDTYGGRYAITISVGGQIVSVTAGPTMSESELGALLTKHPLVHYNTPDYADNVAIERRTDSDGSVSYLVSWIGNLAPQTILSSSVESGTTSIITMAAPHGYTDGQSVTIASHSGSTPSIDGARIVTLIDDSDTTFSIPVDVSVAGTGGTARPTSAPGLTVADIDLVAPKGVSGTIDLNTISLFKYSRTQDSDSFALLASITRTRASGERRTIFGPTAITLSKEIVDAVTMVPTPLPSYYTTTEADARYARLGSANTFTEEQTFDGDYVTVSGTLNAGGDLNVTGFTTLENDLNAGGNDVSGVGTLTIGSGADPVTATRIKHKTSDTTRTTTTTPSADPDLVIPIAANQNWSFEFIVHVDVESGTPNWKGGLSFPSSPTAVRWTMTVEDHGGGTVGTLPPFTGDSTGNTVNIDATDGATIILRGEIQNGSNAGNISLLWSQDTSSADDTTVQKCSRAIATLIP